MNRFLLDCCDYFRRFDQLLNRINSHHLARSEQGMMAWSTIFAVFVMLIMFAMVGNTVETVNKKIENQNTADSVAYSSAAWLARGMNAVTASNHIIGELNAMYALHHALGGKYLDEKNEENDVLELVGLNVLINLSYGKCLAKLPTPPPMELHREEITHNPIADINSTIYQSKVQLKLLYVQALELHSLGALISKLPIVGLVGNYMQLLAFAAEWKIYQEFVFLRGVQMMARFTKDAKKRLPEMIQIIHIYQRVDVMGITPIKAYLVADSVAKLHHPQASGFVRGDIPSIPGEVSIEGFMESLTEIFPKLPVTREITNRDQASQKENIWRMLLGLFTGEQEEDTSPERKSQMLRATYPWVAHWRHQPVQVFQLSCTLSGAGGKYRNFSNAYSRESSEWLRLRTSRKYKEDLTVINRRGFPFSLLSPILGGNEGEGENGKDILLYVLLDLHDGQHTNDKSQEFWNQDSMQAACRADTIFSVVGFAARPKSKTYSPAFFRQENPNGFLAYSQAILYNANPQQRPRSWNGAGGEQATVGWDTLNWTSNAMEWPWKDADSANPPGILLNWKAKLTPLTQFKMAKVLPSQLLGMDAKTNQILIDSREAQLLLQNH